MLVQAIENLPNTSKVTIRKLKSIQINNYLDLLNYFPSRYEDFSLVSKIGKIQEGETVTLFGKITNSKYQITKNRIKIQVFKLNDGTGEIEFVFYNQAYLLRLIKINSVISISGIVEKFGKKLLMKPKSYEIGEPLKHTGRIIPIYPEKKDLSSKTIREKIFFLLKEVKLNNNIIEFLPRKIIDLNYLTDEAFAYKQIHFPDSFDDVEKSKERLAFDELFTIQLSSKLVKKQWLDEKIGYKFQVQSLKSKIQEFINNFPFKLTTAQEKVWQEISSDLQKKNPMNRLLQGEVGSGKTVIAALSCYLAYLNGFRSLLMAPTEILADQHYKTLIDLFKKTNVKIGLYTSSKKTKVNLGFQEFDIIVGTHALITKGFNVKKVGLVIIDEQHRFGVNQRAELKNKGFNSHLLTMTATPIPRTVTLTLYGELDLSILDQLPKNRLPIKTYFVPKIKRYSCYNWIKTQIIKNSSQAFVVCPLIDESEKETMKSVKAAKKEFEILVKVFPQFKLGLLHGKMKSEEKENIMTKFENNRLNVLITTSVVEVGVDIPNATIMIIEGAERFGLAQLHQLRGRVGRSNKQSYCFLFSENENKTTAEKLHYFSKIQDGNKLAEEDLKRRGPGDLYGIKQHGYIELKIANMFDQGSIEKAKKSVNYFIDHYSIDNFQLLKEKVSKLRFKQITKD